MSMRFAAVLLLGETYWLASFQEEMGVYTYRELHFKIHLRMTMAEAVVCTYIINRSVENVYISGMTSTRCRSDYGAIRMAYIRNSLFIDNGKNYSAHADSKTGQFK